MHRPAAFAAALLLIVSTSALAQQKKVTLKSGGQFTGTVEEKDGRYLVHTSTGVIPVEKDQVASIEPHVSLEDRYKQRLAETDPKDPEQRYELAKWAFDNDLLGYARKDLLAALAVKSDYERAALLLRRVEARMAIEAGPKSPSHLTPDVSTRPAEAEAASETFDPRWLVTNEEMNRIRVAELRDNDLVTIVFEDNALNRFIDAYSSDPQLNTPDKVAQFRTWPPARRVNFMLEMPGARVDDLARDIAVKTDPAFMVEFRSRVWPLINSNCSTAQCHGGTSPVGGLRLFRATGRSANVIYTDFLMLDSFQAGAGRLIDRDFPERSLLLQYGLPREDVRMPHPRHIRTVFPGKNTPTYRAVLKWIEDLKGPPHPRYDVTLRVPWMAPPPPATMPAETRPVEDATPPDTAD
jgi:hypothetical protein